MIIEGAAFDQCAYALFSISVIPVNSVRQTCMFVEAFHDFPSLTVAYCAIKKSREADDFEPVMHTSNEEIRLSSWLGMPLDTPCASADLCFAQRNLRFPDIE